MRFPIPLVLAALVMPAQAELVVQDDSTYGAGSVTLDTDTGLQWLDLSQTVGLSVNAVLGGTGGFINDFDVATVMQVETLFLNAGWDGIDNGSGGSSPQNANAADLLLSRLGQTLNDPTFGEGHALFNGGTLIPFYAPDQGRIGCLSGHASSSCERSLDDELFYVGVFLVRPDTDRDSVPDRWDNCTEVANTDQRDTDADGFGNLCDADLNQDCSVNFQDLALMSAVFFSADPDADLNGDGVVNFSDLSTMRDTFFGSPGPSGLPNLCDP